MRKFISKSATKLFIAITVASLLFPFFAQTTEAANLTLLSDTMTRLQTSTTSKHTIQYTMTNGVAIASTMTITFPAGFTMNSIAFGDMTVTWGPSTGLETSVPLAANCTTTTNWSAVLAGQVITFTPCSAATPITGGGTTEHIIVTLGTGATLIANPVSNASYSISIGGTMADSGSFAVPIMASDQVNVSATVNPSITSTLSSASCALGNPVTTANVFTCNYNNQVVTNAVTGYTTYVDAGGQLTSGTHTMTAGSGTFTNAAEAYGVSTVQSGQSISQISGGVIGNCTNGASLGTFTAFTPGTPQKFGTGAGPTAGDTNYLCHALAITGATPAGTYSQTVTITTTGNF